MDDMEIPTSLKQYFWDVDLGLLDTNRDSRFILERILEKGNDNAVRWLEQVYPYDQVAKVVTDSRRLSPKSRNYWGIKLHLWSTWNQSVAQPAPIWQR